VLAAVGLVYLGSIPFSVARFYQLKRTYEAPQPAEGAAAPAEAGAAPPPQPPEHGGAGTFTRH
jgi:hypothetical protein